MVEGEEEVEVEEEEVGERLAHLEGRRRLAGRAGLEKFFRTEEEETEDFSFSCGETNELPFRIITLLYQQSVSHTQILYILSRVPSVVVLTLGETTGIFQTGTLINSACLCGKVTHPISSIRTDSMLFWTMLLRLRLNSSGASNYIVFMRSNKIVLIIIPTISLTFA